MCGGARVCESMVVCMLDNVNLALHIEVVRRGYHPLGLGHAVVSVTPLNQTADTDRQVSVCVCVCLFC